MEKERLVQKDYSLFFQYVSIIPDTEGQKKDRIITS